MVTSPWWFQGEKAGDIVNIAWSSDGSDIQDVTGGLTEMIGQFLIAQN